MGGASDLAIDTLWGEPGRAALRSLGLNGRLVQVGNAASATVDLPAGPLRGGRLDIRGFSVFNEGLADIARSYRELCALMAAGGVALDIETMPLEDAPVAWGRQRAGTGGAKLVLVPG
jgi:D-arabinose 1-dehydrogenase-like Zn-dependent alcohol dehydrogenase